MDPYENPLYGEEEGGGAPVPADSGGNTVDAGAIDPNISVVPVGSQQPPADLPAREAGPVGHTMTIYQGGRREDYRFQPNARGQLEINPEDYAASHQRAQFAEQEQKLRLRSEFSHADALRLEQLQTARSNIERDKMAGILNDREANGLLGLVMSGASELQARQQFRLQQDENRKLTDQINKQKAGVMVDAEGNIAWSEKLQSALIPKEVKDPATGEVIGHIVPKYSRRDGLSADYHPIKDKPSKGDTDQEIRKQAEASTFLPKTDPGYADAVESRFNKIKEEHDDKKNAGKNPEKVIADLTAKRQQMIEDAAKENRAITDPTKRAADATKRNEQINRLSERIKNLLPSSHAGSPGQPDAGQPQQPGQTNFQPGGDRPPVNPAQAIAQKYAAPEQGVQIAPPEKQRLQTEYDAIKANPAYKGQLSNAPPEVQARFKELKRLLGP